MDTSFSCWAFNNIDFVADLQYSVSINFLQNTFKVHRTIGFSSQDKRQLLNHTWSTFFWRYCGTSIYFPNASIFFNHFTLLDPRKYFNFVGTKELFHFARIRKLFHQGITRIFLEPRNYSILLEPWLEPRNYSASLKSRSYSIFVGFVSGTRELLSFFFTGI